MQTYERLKVIYEVMVKQITYNSAAWKEYIRFAARLHKYSFDNNLKHSGDDQTPDTWYVTKGHYILKTKFESKEDALKWLKENASQQTNDRKKRFIPPQLKNVKREGPDYRNDLDIEGQDYLDTFGFKGGEFGNWMNQNDRQTSLNLGYDALKDLADALQISDHDISYNGALSIAFGARGSGSAFAHYEPLRIVINLTKMRGAGSLAHEWWHGLDDYLGAKLGVGGYLSDHPRQHPAMDKLIDVIKYKPETTEQAAEREEKQIEVTRDTAEKWLKSTVSSQLQNNEKNLPEYEKLRQDFLRGEAGSIEKINNLQKSVVGRVIPKEARKQLEHFENWLGKVDSTPPAIRNIPTEYLRNSKAMSQTFNKDGGYWDSNVELTARAFSTYIMDKLGRRSDYLIGHAECAVSIVTDPSGETKIIKAYPQGEERKRINRAFDNLILELKQQQYLNHDERQEPKVLPHIDLKKESISANNQISLFNELFYSQEYEENQDEDMEM